MKTIFAAAALLGATVDAGIVMDVVGDTTTIFNQTPIKWEITVNGVFDRDSGEEFFQLTHTLTADILVTDKIEFVLSYTGGDIPVKPDITEDAATCAI